MFSKYKFEDLVDLMESELNVDIVLEKKENHKFSLRSGDNAVTDDKITEINFRFEEDILLIPTFYLSIINKGIGTKIMNWFIEFSKSNNIKAIEVSNVKHDKVEMKRLLESNKFDFNVIKGGEYKDYSMKI